MFDAESATLIAEVLQIEISVCQHSPHVDQILSECNGIGIAADGDCTIGVAAFALLAIRDPNHGTGYLTDLGNLGSALADYTADQIIWHSHFVLLGVGLCSTRRRAQL
jgi:hypothetical protein